MQFGDEAVLLRWQIEEIRSNQEEQEADRGSEERRGEEVQGRGRESREEAVLCGEGRSGSEEKLARVAARWQ